mmetsp:Transcript_7592/g.15767  ORF Transcript_7592/g.15767 Transcript_7592/m.15767 type:complete len:248 (-) Transcript_7592:183-926(-)
MGEKVVEAFLRTGRPERASVAVGRWPGDWRGTRRSRPRRHGIGSDGRGSPCRLPNVRRKNRRSNAVVVPTGRDCGMRDGRVRIYSAETHTRFGRRRHKNISGRQPPPPPGRETPSPSPVPPSRSGARAVVVRSRPRPPASAVADLSSDVQRDHVPALRVAAGLANGTRRDPSSPRIQARPAVKVAAGCHDRFGDGAQAYVTVETSVVFRRVVVGCGTGRRRRRGGGRDQGSHGILEFGPRIKLNVLF